MFNQYSYSSKLIFQCRLAISISKQGDATIKMLLPHYMNKAGHLTTFMHQQQSPSSGLPRVQFIHKKSGLDQKMKSAWLGYRRPSLGSG